MCMLSAVPQQAQRLLLGKAVTGTSIDKRPRPAWSRRSVTVAERPIADGRSTISLWVLNILTNSAVSGAQEVIMVGMLYSIPAIVESVQSP